MTTKKRPVYKIQFHNQGKLYELYAREVTQSMMYAFVEVADIIFGEKSQLVVDPSEERLKQEFGLQHVWVNQKPDTDDDEPG